MALTEALETQLAGLDAEELRSLPIGLVADDSDLSARLGMHHSPKAGTGHRLRLGTQRRHLPRSVLQNHFHGQGVVDAGSECDAE